MGHVDEIRARLERATPADQWDINDGGAHDSTSVALIGADFSTVWVEEDEDCSEVRERFVEQRTSDLVFAANAPADVAFLLARVAELEEQRESTRARVAALWRHCQAPGTTSLGAWKAEHMGLLRDLVRVLTETEHDPSPSSTTHRE